MTIDATPPVDTVTDAIRKALDGIAPGYLADLLVVDSSPLDDPRVLRTPQLVISRGTVAHDAAAAAPQAELSARAAALAAATTRWEPA